MRSISRFLCVFILINSTLLYLSAQGTPEGKKHWESAKKSASKKDFDKSIQNARKCLDFEKGRNNSAAFLTELYGHMATSFEAIGRKDSAIKYLYLGTQQTLITLDSSKAADYIIRINSLYHLCRTDTGDIWLQRLLGSPKTRKQFLMFKTINLIEVRYDWREGDTCWFYSNGGLNDGVFDKSAVGFYSLHKPTYRSRPVTFLGEGEVITSYAQKSYGYFVFNQDFFDTIYVRDGIYTSTSIPDLPYKNDIYQTAISGFYSSKPGKTQFYIYPTTSLYFTEPFFAESIYRAMLGELKNQVINGGDYSGYDPNQIIEDGRFKGYTLREALKQSTLTDIEHFINIPGTYKTTYYNYNQEFAYEYIYWLTHEAYTGSNQSILWNVINKTPASEIESATKKYGFYYNYWDLLDSMFLSWVDTMADYPDKLAISEKMLAFAKNSGNDIRINRWIEKLGIMCLENNDYVSAEKYSIEWYKSGTSPEMSTLYAGISMRFNSKYAESRKMLDALLDNEVTIRKKYQKDTADWLLQYAGIYSAWSHYMTGDLPGGSALIGRMYPLDSNQRVFRSYYGFSKALAGETAEADRHFVNYLSLLYNPSQYSHIVRCFKEIGSKGILKNWFEAEQTKIDSIYRNQFLTKITLDSLVDNASVRYKESTKESAFAEYQKALKYCFTYRPKDSSNLIFILDWLGYIGIEVNQDSMSLEYYKTALDICEKFKFGNEKILWELDNIIYTSSLLDKATENREYSIKYRKLKAEQRRRENKKLYVFTTGTNNSSKSKVAERFAEKDAKDVSNALYSRGRLYYDTVINVSLTGNNLTLDSINDAFDSIALNISTNDAFVFYYAGPTRENNYLVQLNLVNDYYLASELAVKLSAIKCDHKVIILDGGNLPIDSLYTSVKRLDKTLSEQSSLFLGTGDWRYEPDGVQHGAITDAVLSYLTTDSGDRVLTTSGVMAAVYRYFSNSTLKMPISSISVGLETELGVRKMKTQTNDTTYPNIILYNARQVNSRGDNILLAGGQNQNVSGEISDPAGVMFAWINGKPLKLLPNGKFNYPKSNIQGSRFEIRAVNKNGFMDSVVAEVEEADNSKDRPTRKEAWFFATNEYYSPYWNKLNNPVFDAEAVGDILEKYYGFQVKIERNKTQAELRQSLRNLMDRQSQQGDQLLIYFAGHGYNHKSEGFKLVCKDAGHPDSNDFSNYLAGSELYHTYLKKISWTNKMLVMDVCHAGLLADDAGYVSYEPVSASLAREKPLDFIRQKKSIPVFEFYMSGRANSVEDGVPGSHSPFANQLISNFSSGSFKEPFLNLQYLKRNEVQYGNKSEWMPVAGYFARGDNGEFLFEVTRRPDLKVDQPVGSVSAPKNP